jgi:hypothetical protein
VWCVVEGVVWYRVCEVWVCGRGVMCGVWCMVCVCVCACVCVCVRVRVVGGVRGV